MECVENSRQRLVVENLTKKNLVCLLFAKTTLELANHSNFLGVNPLTIVNETFGMHL